MSKGIAAAGLIALFFLAACEPVEPALQPRYFVPPDADTVDPSANGASGGLEGGAGPTDAGPSDAASSIEGGASDAGDAGPSDPSLLALTGWWRASFTGTTWAGTASAGGSAGRNLVEATNPPSAGAPVAGLAPASFDGTNDQLVSTVAVSTYLSATAWEVHGLFSADAAPIVAAGLGYTAPALLTDTVNGSFYIGFGNLGVIAGQYDGSAFKEVTSPCPTGGLHVFQAWFDGTKLNLMIDGGIPANPVASGTALFGPGTLKVGTNYQNNATLNGRIFELLTSATVLNDTTRTNVRLYFNKRYGTTFR